MGNTKSQMRKLHRRASCNIQMWTSLSRSSKDGFSTGNSRSHSLASNTTGHSDSSRLSCPELILSSPSQLTPDQLSLIKYSWHLVSVDTSNVCLNFFHQLQRRFPRIKRLQKSKMSSLNNSTPSLPSSLQLMTRNQSCTAAYTTQGLLTRQALTLACCLDAVIGSLLRHPSGICEEKILLMLSEKGFGFKKFLGFQSFYSDALVVKEMTVAFCESLRLVLVHNGAKWSGELQQAWEILFGILLWHLDGVLEEQEDIPETSEPGEHNEW